jgi:hypothetical protein
VNDGILYSISKKGHDMVDVELGERWRPGGRRMMASKINADARRHFPSPNYARTVHGAASFFSSVSQTSSYAHIISIVQG